MENEDKKYERDLDNIINANTEHQIVEDINKNHHFSEINDYKSHNNRGSINVVYLIIAIVVVVIGGIYLGYLLAK